MNPYKLITRLQEICIYVAVFIYLFGIAFLSLFWNWLFSKYGIEYSLFYIGLWFLFVVFLIMLAFYPSQFSKTNITRHARNQRSLLN